MSDFTHALLSLAITYLIHSSLLIGAVWLFLRLCPVRSNPVREALWTVALFGGIGTAALAGSGTLEAGVGRWNVLPAPASARADAGGAEQVATANPGATPVAPHADVPRASRFHRDAFAADPAALSTPSVASDLAVPPATLPRLRAALPAAAHHAETGVALDAGTVCVLVVLAIALLSILSLVLSTMGGLRDRHVVACGPLRDQLDALSAPSASTRVRLSHSPRLASPVAFGLWRPEICVPTRALSDLRRAAQRAMLAHELAHLRRRDPLRLLMCRIVETVLFFQPLNRFARRRLFEVIECRCDAWAVARVGHGIALAECLAEVAGWLAEGPAQTRVAMASTGSPLLHRIHRLLRDGEADAEETRRRRLAPLALLLLPGVLLGAPVIGSAEPRARAEDERPRALVPVPAPVPSPTPRQPARLAPRVAIGTDVTHAASILDAEIEILAQQVRDLRAALIAAPGGASWLATLEPIEQRLLRLEGQRATLRALHSKLTQRGRLAPLSQDSSVSSHEPSEERKP